MDLSSRYARKPIEDMGQAFTLANKLACVLVANMDEFHTGGISAERAMENMKERADIILTEAGA